MENLFSFLPFCRLAAGLLLLGISIYDIEARIIPDSLILAGIFGYTIIVAAKQRDVCAVISIFFNGMLAAVPVLCLVLLIDHCLNRPSMGGGDLKLIFMLGMTTSPLLSLAALTIASFTALILWFLTGTLKDKKIPFGPSLCFGWIVSWHIRCFLPFCFS